MPKYLVTVAVQREDFCDVPAVLAELDGLDPQGVTDFISEAPSEVELHQAGSLGWTTEEILVEETTAARQDAGSPLPFWVGRTDFRSFLLSAVLSSVIEATDPEAAGQSALDALAELMADGGLLDEWGLADDPDFMEVREEQAAEGS